MGKLFKKSGDGEEDTSNRKALFGSRSKNKAQPEQPTNPYAKPIPTDPYTKAKFYAGVNPMKPSDQPGPPNQMSGPPAGYAPGPAGPPGGNGFPPDVKQGGYTPNQYGNQGGYGSDRFGGGGASSRYGPGGYGGLGSADPNNPGDANRDALFGGAQERVAQQQVGGAPPPYSSQDGGYPGGSNEYSNTSMYQERQLTAEEEEDEEIQAIKEEMKFVKQGDVASTRNALRVAAQTEDVGKETLARLGAQGEHVHDTEKSLDMATIEGRIAEDKAKELKQLNKSMFAMRVSNPFTSARRRRERDEKILSNHRNDRDVREGTRHEAFQGNQRMEMTFREIDRDARMPKGKAKKNMTERAKYQFEADSEDEAMEDEIEGNLNLIHGAAGRLNGLSRATGRELDEQNRHLERITGKSDFVDDQLAMNRARLDRIN